MNEDKNKLVFIGAGHPNKAAMVMAILKEMQEAPDFSKIVIIDEENPNITPFKDVDRENLSMKIPLTYLQPVPLDRSFFSKKRGPRQLSKKGERKKNKRVH